MRWRWEFLILVMLILAVLGQQAARNNRARRRSQRLALNGNGRNRLAGRQLNAVNRGRLRPRRALRNGKSATKVEPKIVGGTKVSAQPQGRILGGTSNTIDNFRWLVQVRRSTTLCGGTLIHPQFVITAGHCVRGYRASQYRVRGGTTALDGSDGVVRSVTRLFVHPRFNARTMNMDAALLRLNATMTGDRIAIIPMATAAPGRGSRVRMAGWGVTREGGSTSQQLRSIQIGVVGRPFCRRRYRGIANINRNMFCARGRNKDTCSGDSGGPVVLNGRLVGVVSFGYGCGRFNYPGVYTTVARIAGWANNTITNNS